MQSVVCVSLAPRFTDCSRMIKLVFLLCLLLSPSYARRSGGGGGGFRGGSSGSVGGGGSAARAGAGGNFNQGGFHPNQGGFQPQQNNFHPQPNQGFHPQSNQGFHPQSNQGFRPQPNQGFHQPNQGFHPNQPHFTNTGLGSPSRGSSFKTALAGAALGTIGGLAAFELGKAIIHSASSPFQYDNKNYYWGPEHYKQQSGQFMCSMPLEQLIQQTAGSTTTTTTTTAAPDATTAASDDTHTTTPSPADVLSKLQFADGSRPKQIVWGCKQGAEVCCGTDCCPAPQDRSAGGGPNGASRGTAGSIAAIVIGFLVFFL